MQRSGDCQGQLSGAAWVGEKGPEKSQKGSCQVPEEASLATRMGLPRKDIKEAIGTHTTEHPPDSSLAHQATYS